MNATTDSRLPAEKELDAMRAALATTKDPVITAALKARITELRIMGAESRRFHSQVSW